MYHHTQLTIDTFSMLAKEITVLSQLLWPYFLSDKVHHKYFLTPKFFFVCVCVGLVEVVVKDLKAGLNSSL